MPAAAPDSYHFHGDAWEEADRCARLVAAREKRATAPSAAELQHAEAAIAQAGDRAIVTDGQTFSRILGWDRDDRRPPSSIGYIAVIRGQGASFRSV